jgi:uncharacterized membrane protein
MAKWRGTRKIDHSPLNFLAGRHWTRLSLGRGRKTAMAEVLNNPTVQAVLGIVVLCVLVASGFYLVSIFRDYAANDHQGTEDVLANLRELHLKGDISDAEFRTIESKTKLKRDADLSS